MILFNGILSIIIIFIAHQLWEYCKINYTTQKTKNLVETQASKYKQIAEDMERNSSPMHSGSYLNSSPMHSDEYATTHRASEMHSGSYLNSTTLVMVESPPKQLPVKIQPSDFLPLDEKEWVHKELATFIDTL